jgi:hypothetical protein
MRCGEIDMPTIEKRAGVDVLVMGTGCRPATDAEVAFSAEIAALRAALDSIRQYGSDTLSGRTDGPDDRKWQRDAVLEMTNRASRALKG